MKFTKMLKNNSKDFEQEYGFTPDYEYETIKVNKSEQEIQEIKAEAINKLTSVQDPNSILNRTIQDYILGGTVLRGKHAGKEWLRLKTYELKEIADEFPTGTPEGEKARELINGRDEVNSIAEISLHAINRASTRLLDMYLGERDEYQGIATWLAERSNRALKAIKPEQIKSAKSIIVFSGKIKFTYALTNNKYYLVTVALDERSNKTEKSERRGNDGSNNEARKGETDPA